MLFTGWEVRTGKIFLSRSTNMCSKKKDKTTEKVTWKLTFLHSPYRFHTKQTAVCGRIRGKTKSNYLLNGKLQTANRKRHLREDSLSEI